MRLHAAAVASASLFAITGVAHGEAPSHFNKLSTQSVPSISSSNEQDIASSNANANEIIVTASRRSERLQTTPVAVQAVRGDALVAKGLNSTTDLQYVSPSLNYAQGTSATSSGFRVRGVGTAAFSAANEQSVGLAVDGVSMGVAAQGLGSFVDVDRVEVLRGPQGMLFGKNASAGLVSIISNAPTYDAIHGLVRAYYTDVHEEIFTGVLNMPTGQASALRIAGQYRHSDGVSRNATDGTKVNDLNDIYVRARYRVQASDALRIDLYGDYSRSTGKCCELALRMADPSNPFVQSALAVGVKASPENQTVAITPGTILHNDQKNWGGATEITLNLGSATLTSLSAYREFKLDNPIDGDAAPFPGIVALGSFANHQFSQELRLASSGQRPLTYVLGAYFFKNSGNRNTGFGGAFINLRTYNEFDTRSFAVFGQGEYHLDKLTLIGGLRYTTDLVNQSNYGGASATGPVALQIAGRVTADNVSFRGGAKYDFTGKIMTYVTVSRGYKGPTFSSRLLAGATSQSAIQVHPELSTNYEAGLRMALFGNALTINPTVFLTDFTNFQAQTFDPSSNSQILTNAGGLRTKGVELEASLRVAPSLRFDANIAYVDARYTDFRGVSCSSAFNALAPSICVRQGASSVFLVDATGYQLTSAPRWSLNTGAHYEHSLWGQITFSGDINYSYRTSAYFTPADPYTVQKAYGLIDLTLGMGDTTAGWRASFFVRNLFDKRFTTGITQSFPALGMTYQQTVPFEARRRIGASIEYRF